MMEARYWTICEDCGVIHLEGHPHRCEPEDWRDQEPWLCFGTLQDVWDEAGGWFEDVAQALYGGDEEEVWASIRRHRPDVPYREWTARDVAVLWTNVLIDGGIPPIEAARSMSLDRGFPVQWPA